MQQAHQAAASALQSASKQKSKLHTSATPNQPAAASSTAKPSALIADYVWLHMSGLFGNAWTSTYGDNPRSAAGAEWAKTLTGLNRSHIDAGLDGCRSAGSDWPPSAPRFLAMCRGIPSFARVSNELAKSPENWSAFTRAVRNNLDEFIYRNSSTKDARRLLQDAYDVVNDMVMRGDPLPEPVPFLSSEERPIVLASRDQAHRRWADIAQVLGLSDGEVKAMQSAGIDPLDDGDRRVTGKMAAAGPDA